MATHYLNQGMLPDYGDLIRVKRKQFRWEPGRIFGWGYASGGAEVWLFSSTAPPAIEYINLDHLTWNEGAGCWDANLYGTGTAP